MEVSGEKCAHRGNRGKKEDYLEVRIAERAMTVINVSFLRRSLFFVTSVEPFVRWFGYTSVGNRLNFQRLVIIRT